MTARWYRSSLEVRCLVSKVDVHNLCSADS